MIGYVTLGTNDLAGAGSFYDDLLAAIGAMVAIHVADHAQTDALHAKALALGGKDEGAPGPRAGTFYGAYVRDLDGNKLCFFAM